LKQIDKMTIAANRVGPLQHPEQATTLATTAQPRPRTRTIFGYSLNMLAHHLLSAIVALRGT
jgi:hypothetical protein